MSAFPDEAIRGLTEGLEQNVRLQEIVLDHNQITDDGAKQLYLKAFKANQQRRIRLSAGNPLTSECKVMLAAISQAHDLRKRFVKEFASQEKLEFSARALRQYGAAAIADELVAASASKCRCLDFSRNSLGDEGAQVVATLLRSYPLLEELDVSFNDIGDEGAIALAEALVENSTLTSFSLHSALEGSQAKPKLQEKGLCHLARAIQHHKALVKVDLRDNLTSPAVVRAFVEMLRCNQGIQKFNGTNAAVFLARYE
jgi:Ran GTPase-activating protein (RanGAP) involved in mRNA processing and transport